jgi:FkbM family methyltransferase
MNAFIRSCVRLVFGKLFPRVAYPVVRGPLRGARFILGALAGEGGGATVYFNMIEAEQTSAFVKTMREGYVLFDIGANVGYYTILGARLVGSRGRVFAFEPALRNLVYLNRHVLINKASNVSIISAACSDALSLTVFESGENFATGHLIDSKNVGNSKGICLVPTVSVDTVVQQLGIYPDVIKADVEGAELSVLKGAHITLQQVKPQIFLSTHSEELRSACLEYLKKIGYAFEVLSKDKDNPSEFLAKWEGM